MSKKQLSKQSKILKAGSKKVARLQSSHADTLPDHHFKKVKVKRGIAGLGLFAAEPIKKGELIIEYIGEILTKAEADKITTNQYLFEVSNKKTINGAVRWNIARYANHSCDGNAESDVRKGRVFMKAIKQIKEGEEIVYDYGEEFVNEYIAKYGCNCSATKHLYGLVGAKEKIQHV